MSKLNFRDLVVDNEKTLGREMILIEVADTYRYADNERTSDVIGKTYTVLLPERGCATLAVKVPGTGNAGTNLKVGGVQRVRFQNLTLTPYAMNGRSGVSAKATGIIVVGNDAKAGNG